MKNILITGASGEIGQAVSKKLADEGFHLLLHYHTNRQAMLDLQQYIPPDQLLACLQADLSTDKGIKQFLSDIFATVDGIVFASGKEYVELLQYASDDMMEKLLTLHVKTPWKITRALLPSMLARKCGKIISISSIWGDIGASNEVLYSSVKGAQNSFVKALAKEVSPSGIQVNGVSPGFIQTRMNDHLSSDDTEETLGTIPLGRAGTPLEVAHAVAWLLSENTKYIQGEIIPVTGGW